MSYKTQIIDDKKAKRDQLAKQMDNFSTFKWRGESAFDKFGMFIIAEKRGDLKFYNGPSFSNEYSKPQFAASSGDLLGVTFNRQQVAFKVGMYYFSIEEWQDFIEWVNAYEVNYLTFMYAPKYGYLVKLAKMEDTPRYIVGYSNREPMYYTEMTLTWDLQGDNCVRANLPYEWVWENNQFTLDSKGPTKESRLETPLLLTLPLNISSDTCQVQFKVKNRYETNWTTLFSVKLNNLPTNTNETWIGYKVKTTLASGVYTESGLHIASVDGRVWTAYEIIVSETKDDTTIIIVNLSNEKGETYQATQDEIIKFQNPTETVNSFFEIYGGLKIDELITQNYFLNYPTLRYDSETGVVLYAIGDNTFKLLHLNMIDADGNYTVSNIVTKKYKLKYKIDDFTFQIVVDGAVIPIKPLLQIYERTNVI